ncbi:hypothetical protein ACLB2K_053661 [Fragaria x ananassa]
MSSLSSLIHDSSQILDSLSALLPVPSQDDSDDIDCHIFCPVNPHHRLHPHSLFSHFLRCPPPLHHLIPPLHYPKTFKSTDQSQSGESFIQSGDLCLSLEHYYAEFGCNYFYRDWQTFTLLHWMTFTLPSVLSAECVNFSVEEVREMMDCDKVAAAIAALHERFMLEEKN